MPVSEFTKLGPGQLEPVYEQVLAHELPGEGIGCERQVEIPVVYRSVQLDTPDSGRISSVVQHETGNPW
jgi:GxxExxY protein